MSNHDILNIAHRGASGYAPENTHAAFEKAIEMGADGIELDVQLTADNRIVVMHDEKLDRTTNLKGHLKKFTLEQLKQGDAGSWFSPEFGDETVPLFDNVIEQVKGKMLLDIEVKYHTAADLDIVKPLLQLLERTRFNDFIITSFSDTILYSIKDLAPHIAVGLIFSKMSDFEKADTRRFDYVCPKFTLISEKNAALWNSMQKRLWTWTPNTETEILPLIDSGVEAIISNYPDRVKKLLKNTKNT